VGPVCDDYWDISDVITMFILFESFDFILILLVNVFHFLKTCNSFFFKATVVCKQLGYTDAARFTTGSSFGLVSGNFSYVNVHCSGYEKNIDQCPHSNSHNCDPYSGAGVVCTTTSTTTTIKTSTTRRPYSSTTPRDSGKYYPIV